MELARPVSQSDFEGAMNRVGPSITRGSEVAVSPGMHQLFRVKYRVITVIDDCVTCITVLKHSRATASSALQETQQTALQLSPAC